MVIKYIVLINCGVIYVAGKLCFILTLCKSSLASDNNSITTNVSCEKLIMCSSRV